LVYFDSVSDSWHRLLAVVHILPLDPLTPASFLTSVVLAVTHLGKDLQQMMDQILKALHPRMCIKPATIIVEGYTQRWGRPNCLPGFNMLYFAAVTLTESDGLACVNWPPS
jgi:hypothetical protein